MIYSEDLLLLWIILLISAIIFKNCPSENSEQNIF